MSERGVEYTKKYMADQESKDVGRTEKKLGQLPPDIARMIEGFSRYSNSDGETKADLLPRDVKGKSHVPFDTTPNVQKQIRERDYRKLPEDKRKLFDEGNRQLNNEALDMSAIDSAYPDVVSNNIRGNIGNYGRKHNTDNITDPDFKYLGRYEDENDMVGREQSPFREGFGNSRYWDTQNPMEREAYDNARWKKILGRDDYDARWYREGR